MARYSAPRKRKRGVRQVHVAGGDITIRDVSLRAGIPERVRLGDIYGADDEPRVTHRLVVTGPRDVAVTVTDLDTDAVTEAMAPCEVPVGAAAEVSLLSPADVVVRAALLAGSTGDLPSLRRSHAVANLGGTVAIPQWAVTAEWLPLEGATVVAAWLVGGVRYPCDAQAIHYVPPLADSITFDGGALLTFSR